MGSLEKELAKVKLLTSLSKLKSDVIRSKNIFLESIVAISDEAYSFSILLDKGVTLLGRIDIVNNGPLFGLPVPDSLNGYILLRNGDRILLN